MASTGEAWKLGHRPALDGVRGVAILLVVARHVGAGQTPVMSYAGPVGVTVFFVLSGYLICGLLLRELDTTSALSLARFYGRRAKRLLPAFFVTVAAAPLVYWAVGDPRLETVGPASTLAAAYLMDLAAALGHVPATFGHTWSLAVEEQFYLLWPLVLVTTWRRRVNLSRAIGLLTVAALGWRLFATATLSADWVRFAPDANAYALLAGCWLASLERDGRLPTLPAPCAGYLAAPVIALGAWPWLGESGGAWAQTAAGVLGTALVMAAATAHSGWLTSPAMRWFGRISYGWYLWHGLLIWLAFDIPGRAVLAVVSLGIAWLSWRFVESPILAWRSARNCAVQPVELTLAQRPVENGHLVDVTQELT